MSRPSPPPTSPQSAPSAEDAGSEIDIDALAEAYNSGLAAEKTGDRAAAVAAYRRALALDPFDRGGVSVRLAALGDADAPDRAPPSYVATLFDQHADVFDHMLVEELGYDAPMQLRDALIACASQGCADQDGADQDGADKGGADQGGADKGGGRPRFERFLDLGCGTGLLAEALEDMVGAADGVDLSEEMVAIAHDKEVYAALYVGDAATFLDTAPADARWELIAATDVAPYLGDLAPLIGAAAARLAPNGWLAFSTETLDDDAFGGAPYRVGPRHRFAHREAYVRDCLSAAKLDVAHMERIVVRYDEGAPTPGHLAVARARR